MNVLFTIGIVLAIAMFVPKVALNAWMRHQRSMYSGMPLKMQEIRSKYRMWRWLVFLVQISGIILAIYGVSH